ncbi:hypothetical protein AGMMS49965_22160 [Bacteroidia bacterium]|nr:hypothetical protein AGMMS49965_22160 [Bacteroidia bacterium]
MNFTACYSQSTPESFGNNLFATLKTFSNSNEQSSYDQFSADFLQKDYANGCYKEIISKGIEKGVDWSKIQFIKYYHKEFQKNGKKYSSGVLSVKLSAKSDYKNFAFYTLNIQVGQSYYVLKCNDKWSRDTNPIPDDRARSVLDNIAKDWVQ